MSIAQIIQSLESFKPFAIEDVENDNENFLWELMENWKSNPNRSQAIPYIFRLIERYPHAELGTPGPLVHALETFELSSYVDQLEQSLERLPTPLTLWMYNRIINGEEIQAIHESYVERMRRFSSHPLIDEETQSVAVGFIKHQEGTY